MFQAVLRGGLYEGIDVQKLEDKVLLNAVKLLKMLPILPDIFPTFRDSIQFEYEKSNGEYLEFEVFEYKIGIFGLSSDGREKEFQIILGDKKEGILDERI